MSALAEVLLYYNHDIALYLFYNINVETVSRKYINSHRQTRTTNLIIKHYLHKSDHRKKIHKVSWLDIVTPPKFKNLSKHKRSSI